MTSKLALILNSKRNGGGYETSIGIINTSSRSNSQSFENLVQIDENVMQGYKLNAKK